MGITKRVNKAALTMRAVFAILLYGLTARQVPQVSDQVSQVSNQAEQVSDQVAQVSNQVTQVSSQTSQVSDQTSQVSNQTPQVAQISNQTPQVSNQTPQVAQVSNQTPQDSDQTPQDSSQVFFDLFDGGFPSAATAAGRQNEVYPDVVEFSGIKFANSERFMSPVAIDDYADTDFSNPGYSCVTVNAVNIGSESLPVDTDRVEDCLYIRIWVKKSALASGAARRKVISWIHGGTFNFGGVDVIYESPAKLVDEQDIIVAKMNYRLGPFGNFYIPHRIDGQPKSSFGILDQRAGLKWIKDHIGKFNGDADDITLGGASSGGMSAMIHMTSPASHDYFHNALVIGAPQIKFWTAEEAKEAYGTISVYGGCTTAETMMQTLADGTWLSCLKNMPLANFQVLCSATGDIFKQIAINAKHLSQLEQLFAINIDGEIVTHDPRDEIKSNSANVKSNMGFYLHELARNEGTSMTQNLFNNEAFKKMLFAENYEVIFNTYGNTAITVPKPAHDGLMKVMYGAAPASLQGALMSDDALGCPVMEGDPSGESGLFTECKHKTADWVTSWLWHCNTRNFLYLNSADGSNNLGNMYLVDFAAAYPGPNHDQPGVLQPDTIGVSDCYEAGAEKSCHIVGQAYLFGEADNQRVIQTDEQLDFGHRYRTLYGDLIKNGYNLHFRDFSDGGYNLVDIGENVSRSKPYAETCHLFDIMDSYGMI